LRAWEFEERLKGGEGGKGGVNFEDLLERDRIVQKEERWEKIRESRFNRWYGWVKGKGVPVYLGKGWGKGRWRRVARFRLGNEVRDGRYWEGEEERKCRFCGNGETWEHVWEECRRWTKGGDGSWQVVGFILGDEGDGEGWMREVEEEKRKAGAGERVRGREWVGERECVSECVCLKEREGVRGGDNSTG
ncbi:hypothetical protein ALC57_17696, partial [Trachymyrmex cornetzi]